MTLLRTRFGVFILLSALAAASSFGQAFGQGFDKGYGVFESIPDLQSRHDGYVGERIDGVVKNWETRALKANPAALSVFQLRERSPKSSEYYVPWVGEFVGKYLENAIMLQREHGDPELQATVDAAIGALMASQDRDGYLGPYSHDERLVVNWDLWGHYHAMTALLQYYEYTGSSDALEHARRAGLFFEKAFYREREDGTTLGVKDVGSDEVNFAMMTSLCQLYRATGEANFLADAHKILTDLEERGDFYREGLAGTEFYRTPQPRWESLHTILGLAELYRAEGDESYRRAFLNLWESVLKRDVHNNGSFSCGEQATGNPFRNGAIETCCTVAWIASTVEALRLTGDPRCADALENSFYNAVCAYTHPSGSWCAYNTPMDGRREGSFQTIVFQSRPGQPELNCCSVNSPRGFGELVNWGVMLGKPDAAGVPTIAVNYYGAGSSTFRLGDKIVTLAQKTNYPVDGRVELTFASRDDSPVEATLNFRVPEWAAGATMTTPEVSEPVAVGAGTYASVTRTWNPGDTVVLDFPTTLRYASGDGDFACKACVYYGPLLLAYDQFFNERETDAIPTIEPSSFDSAEIEFLAANPNAARVGFYSPQLFVKLNSTEKREVAEGVEAPVPVFLTDFAHAGSLGTTYASWIPATGIVPPVPACELPVQDAHVGPGAILFKWRKLATPEKYQLSVVVASTPDFAAPLFTVASTNGVDAIALPEQTACLEPGRVYYWKVAASNDYGTTESLAPGRRFSVDPTLPAFDVEAYRAGKAANASLRVLVEDALDGTPGPTVGRATVARGLTSGEDRGVAFNGEDSLLVYELDAFPCVAFEASVDFYVESAPGKDRIAQIMSAWTKGSDDPLRVALDADGRLYGAVESTSRGGATPHVAATPGEWHTARVVKEGRDWTLSLDGEEVGRVVVGKTMDTDSLAIGLGGNPRFTGYTECLKGRLANFRLSGVCEQAESPSSAE